ncbi:PREDICTED: teashirt homolog 1, partial [Condylura cristata]|uniref:teashirt homolog 1 n=1 Tax=Condylura cristata TaxID=143302 RepID=UPI000643131D
CDCAEGGQRLPSPPGASYVPEEELKAAEIDAETAEEDGLSPDVQDGGQYACDEEADVKEAPSCQDSPVSTATNQDAGYGSPFSESGERGEQPAPLRAPAREEKEAPPGPDGASYPQDSLAQIKAVYANLFSESCWSSLALDLKKSGSTAGNAEAGSGSGGGGGSGYDWHQAALAKTLQQTSSYGLLPEPSLFSTVQLYRQNNKLYGSVFTGASKFRCKDCSAAYDTLVELTVHMNETGHYRDDNRDRDAEKTKRWSKPRKRSLMEMEGKEDAQKVLKCMYCGHSFESLQDLSVHMIKTKHYQKVPLKEPVPALAKLVPAAKRAPAAAAGEPDRKIKEEGEDGADRAEPTALYQYLREEDLDDSPKGGVDILKSLENTVSTAISKAQNGAPSWGGYPSIHAAYQLPGVAKPLPAVQTVPVQPSCAVGKALASEHGALLHPAGSLSPPPHRSNVSAMEELVEKVTGKAGAKKEERPPDKEKGSPAQAASPAAKENKDCPRPEDGGGGGKPQPKKGPDAEAGKAQREAPADARTPNGTEHLKARVTNGGGALGIITDHSPEPPFVSPLSALQSIMNTHLGKVSKPVSPSLDPLAMLYKISNSMLDKPVYPAAPARQADAIDRYYYDGGDQPIDLTKAKSRPLASGAAAAASPLRESALMDISDMVKNLTGRLTPKSSTPSTVSEKSDADGSSFEEALDELSPVHKRKGRQSHWNPQHLLILQAQFASSLRETPEGKYIMSDLGPQERVHISKFTGLSMTTISHWLANVKYQLRRTGGTKFLKNLDSGHPVFFCNDCASQFRTASTYIGHLETHLGFSLKDLSQLPLGQLQEQQSISRALAGKALGPLGAAEDDLGSTFQCKLCNRTFASKHAVKLHLSKTHGKSPEDHLIYVTELEKQ